jgi:FtsP/CotA-like multicopper oxidase with cupredoxin domain
MESNTPLTLFLAALMVSSAFLTADIRPLAPPRAADTALPSASACFAQAVPDRSFEVVAINITIAYNNFGDHDPFGRMYVLAQDEAAVRAAVNAAGRLPADLVQPLVLRAHVGDCVDVRFTNRINDPTTPQQTLLRNGIPTLDPGFGQPIPNPLARVAPYVPEPVNLERASMHVHKALTAVMSQGMMLGNNADSTVGPGESITYRWFLPDDPAWEGTYYFHSHADARYQAAHGLFGALVAEPKGYDWKDPVTGGALSSGWQAMLTYPPGPTKAGHADFREAVLVFHDEIMPCSALSPAMACTLLPSVDDNLVSGAYGPGTKAINYRSEPFMDRFKLLITEVTNGNLTRLGTGPIPGLNAPFDESQAYGSYGNGDPATPIARAYVGDPTKFRILHGGPGQHHVFHLHGGGDRWRFQPHTEDSQFDDGLLKQNPVLRSASERLDVQDMGPGEAYDLEIEGGAGGVQQSVGDFLYHCHIVEHYVAGMWGFWRVYDTLQDGTNPNFPGEKPLQPLPDRAAPPAAVDSTGLVGKVLFPGTPAELLLVAGPSDPAATPPEVNVQEWVERFLPARGVPRVEDASVWDWKSIVVPGGVLVLGEHELNRSWVNYRPQSAGLYETSLGPGRPALQFNPLDGRPAYPMLHPHLGKRPPFAPDHGPAPYLGKEHGAATNPIGLCVPHAQRTSRTYNVVALAVNVTYNARDTDVEPTGLPGGQIFVHAEDKAAVLADPRLAENLVLRANVHDCVDITFTSALQDIQENGFHSKVNMHIHLVQFDVQASDGVITGRNFEQSVRPVSRAKEVANVSAAIAVGATSFQVQDIAPFLDATGQPKVGSMVGVGLTEPGFEEGKLLAVDVPGKTVTLDRPFAKAHAAGEVAGYEFVHYRWYPDVELGMVYWHDHVAGIRSWAHGLFGGLVVEPASSTWTDPRSGTAIKDGTDATRSNPYVDPHVLDIHVPGEADYREAVLALQDRNFVHQGGNGANDAAPPEASFNLRNAPWELRAEDNTDPAYYFSSVVHGDPPTDPIRAYPGDPSVIRLLYAGQSSTRAVNTFMVSGHRFAIERHQPVPHTVATVSFGISSQFNLDLECGAGSGYQALPGDPSSCTGQHAGDFLYAITEPDALLSGAWGVLRVYDRLNSTLLPLPDRASPPGPADTGFPNDVASGEDRIPGVGQVPDPLDVLGPTPYPPTGSGSVGPPGAPVRRYDVAAVSLPIPYNPQGGIVKADGAAFVLTSDLPRLAAGLAQPEPLVLRANAGEVVEVTLTNLLHMPLGVAFNPLEVPVPDPFTVLGPTHGIPPLPRDEASLVSQERVALMPTLVSVDPLGSGGLTVGYDPDMGVLPGHNLTYRWYADKELGAAYLGDFTHLSDQTHVARTLGDLRQFESATIPTTRGAIGAVNGAPHLNRGLFGMLIVEPAGSTWRHPVLGTAVEPGSQAVVIPPSGPAFREFALAFESEDDQFEASMMPYDPAVQGFTGINYRSTPFENRLGFLFEGECRLDNDRCHFIGMRDVRSPLVPFVQSSTIFGDPSTPLLEAFAGDPVVFRVAAASGAQQHVFHVAGHAWRFEHAQSGSNLIDAATIGLAGSIDAYTVAGGGLKTAADAKGDYLYQDHRLAMEEAGMWGILRVHDPADPLDVTLLQPLP